jgi:hypothetical protein
MELLTPASSTLSATAILSSLSTATQLCDTNFYGRLTTIHKLLACLLSKPRYTNGLRMNIYSTQNYNYEKQLQQLRMYRVGGD